ncbi:uncharacterized protein LOC133830202 isoform X2 [Humulus lupulus]|uniref:uncharacterized protein LOC133830202 isoform X2 n=1 Tax=Humulus lupulus TaxID=3486 RepID=UPI002B41416C|nr:uncharacterized protein LOC133830202 isoform X2 [Humulus lupulus]
MKMGKFDDKDFKMSSQFGETLLQREMSMKARVGTIKPMTLFTDVKETSHRRAGALGGSSHIGKGDVQMKMIGPFNASAPILDDPDIASLVEFIFDLVVPDERLVETDFNFLNKDLIRSMGPGKNVMGEVLNVVCEVNTRAALLVSAEDGRAWYLNTRLTVSGISIDSLFPDNGRDDSARKFYFGDLKKCQHIFIPIHNDKIEHWLLFIVHIGDGIVEICDSMLDKHGLSTGSGLVKMVMEKLDYLLADQIADKMGPSFSFTCFQVQTNVGVLQQSNGYDCGIHVINRTEGRHEVYFKHSIFNSANERICIALGLVTSTHNKIWGNVQLGFDVWKKTKNQGMRGD